MRDDYCIRYVCPLCLRTFLDYEYQKDPFCWKCGNSLVTISCEKIAYESTVLELNMYE